MKNSNNFKFIWKMLSEFNKSLNLDELKQIRAIINEMEDKGLSSKLIIEKLKKRFSDKFPEKWQAERAYWTETKRNDTKELEQETKEDFTYYKIKPNIGACEICLKFSNNGKKKFKRSELKKDGYDAPPIHPNCLLDFQANIYTSKGWKQIGKIEIGDLVLTHEGRFRKVTKLLENKIYKGQVIKLHTIKGSFITITPEHPFLTNNGWKKAEDITIDDKLLSLARECKNCNKLFSIIYAGNQLDKTEYCSLHCANQYTAKIQWQTQDRKAVGLKVSSSMKKAYSEGRIDRFYVTRNCKKGVQEKIKKSGYLIPIENRLIGDKNKARLPEVRKKISDSKLGDKNPMRKYSELAIQHSVDMKELFKNNPEKHPNRILAKKGHMTSIEKKMKESLEREKIPFNFNYSVKPYFVDFAIINHNIAIECDGEYWHQNKEKDLIRQQEIENKGWTVLRFTENQINKDINSCILEVKRVIMNHNHEYKFISISVIKIEKLEYKRNHKLYNFSVEEDESYIVKGIVSHNCFCTLIPFE